MRTCNAGFLMGGVAMLCFAAIFIAGRFWLPAAYTPDRSIVELCAWILPIAASFQLFDGVQVVGAGILRGMGRTRAAAVGNAVGYYVLALPLGAWFAFVQSCGVPTMQYEHLPQLGIHERTTGSPFFTRVTSGPISSTTPAPSCPRTTGSGMGSVPFVTERSLWQTPLATSRTITSPARGLST